MKVKICGITDPKDAECAARLGADYVGIIFTPSSNCCVSVSLGGQIAHVARESGSEPVGIFVDETADEIISICRACDIQTIQLHGKISQGAYPVLKLHFSILYVLFVGDNGVLIPGQNIPEKVTLVVDSLKQGPSKPLALDYLSLPKGRDYFIAGGLNPDNVSNVIEAFNPTGVDVSRGVGCSMSMRKDPYLMQSFIQAAKKPSEVI